MKTATNIVGVLAAAGLCAFSGCALVPFPVLRTLPGPIRQIDILEEGTGQPVSDAEVVVYADRFTNWIRHFPPSYSGSFRPPTETSILVPLKQAATGHFIPERRRVWGCDRFWGFGPLGTTIYEDYALTVSARAEGCQSETATYFLATGLKPNSGSTWVVRQETSFSIPGFGTNGALTIFLRRNGAK